MLIQQIVAQNEQLTSESAHEGNKMKNTITSLKTELKSVMKDLRGQKVNYDEIKAQKKFTKIMDKERETQKVTLAEDIEDVVSEQKPVNIG